MAASPSSAGRVALCSYDPSPVAASIALAERVKRLSEVITQRGYTVVPLQAHGSKTAPLLDHTVSIIRSCATLLVLFESIAHNDDGRPRTPPAGALEIGVALSLGRMVIVSAPVVNPHEAFFLDSPAIRFKVNDESLLQMFTRRSTITFPTLGASAVVTPASTNEDVTQLMRQLRADPAHMFPVPAAPPSSLDLARPGAARFEFHPSPPPPMDMPVTFGSYAPLDRAFP